MSRSGPEYTGTQRPAWKLLKDLLDYQYADGESAEFAAERASDAEVLLTDCLARKLKEINPGLTDVGVRQATAALQQPLAAGLPDANEACHRLLSRWVTVEETRGGKLASPSVRYINF